MVEKSLTKDKTVVIPGETLAEGMNYLPGKNAFREGEKICSSILGLLQTNGRIINVIPLSGAYTPKKEDVVIGKITDVSNVGWHVDIDCAYLADLNVREASRRYIEAPLTKFLNIGEYIFGKIIDISETNYVKLTMKDIPYKKLNEGTILKIASTKIPRVIGKKGSMVNMLKQVSNCEILIGQNGLIWISGDPEKERLVVKAIKKIEEEAHKEGLTDRINKLLKEENGKKRKTQ